MNPRTIWLRWRSHDQSTAEIARRMNLPEHVVERVIYECMNARHDKKPMPWDQAA